MSQPLPFAKSLFQGIGGGQSRRKSRERFTRLSHGFTLIELMIGLTIGLISTLAITQILLISESQKRNIISGSDAQISGVLALDSLRQSIQMAGYGFSSSPSSIGCPLEAKFNGAAVAGFPANLVPIVITDGTNDAPDSIRILSSSKSSFSVPINLIDPGYKPADSLLNKSFPVISVRGIAAGDLMVGVIDSMNNCQVFQVTTAPTLEQVNRADDVAHWNPVGFPNFNYGFGQYLINLGTFDDVTFSVGTLGTLQFNKLLLSADFTPSYSGATDVFANVVNMQAYYGKDTDGDGIVDAWNVTTPTTNAGWLQILSVRIAIVSRSNQYEKEVVTKNDLLWDVGANSVITGSVVCGASKCIALKIPRPANSTDWQHYRYKLFDSIVPLRNMLWKQ